MADPGVYSYDPHLRDADDGVVRHLANMPTVLHRVHKKAWRDVRQVLKAHGFIDAINREAGAGIDQSHRLSAQSQVHPAAEPANAFVSAAGTVQFTAASTGSLVVPAGTEVTDSDSDDANETTTGSRIFTTDEAVTVTAGNTGTVAITAQHPGEPWNLPAETTLYLLDGSASLSHFSAAELVSISTDGVDHQLTRAATFRALMLIYLQLTSRQDDGHGYKLDLYRGMYETEMDDIVAAGVRMEIGTHDGVETLEEERLRHGFHRFHRG